VRPIPLGGSLKDPFDSISARPAIAFMDLPLIRLTSFSPEPFLAWKRIGREAGALVGPPDNESDLDNAPMHLLERPARSEDVLI